VLVTISTQRPTTPYGRANALSNYIAGSHLITLKGEGHIGYGRGSASTENAVVECLINGKTPTKSLVCAQ